MSSYWRDRESKHIDEVLKKHHNYEKKIHQMYLDLWNNLNDEILKFYSTYAGKELITIGEAKKAADKFDVQAFAKQAKKYVQDRDFSKEANDQLRTYNLTMRANRLELLKSKIGMHLTGTTDELQNYFKYQLTEDAISEWNRQAGILGFSIISADHYQRSMEAIVESSFHSATYSQRLWTNQDILKSELDRQLTKSILTGKHPDVVARDLRRLVVIDKLRGSETADYVARRLMLSESSRVQSEVQKRSYEEFGYDEYDFMPESSACDLCKAVAKGGPYKTTDMMPGENASPMHSWCRCSTVPSVDKTEFKDWTKEIEGLSMKASDSINKSHREAHQIGKTLQKELLSLIDAESGDVLYQLIGEENRIEFDDKTKELLKAASFNSLILAHNHPGQFNTPFSEADIQTIFDYPSIKALTLQLRNGDQYLYDRNRRKLGLLDKIKFGLKAPTIGEDLIEKYGKSEAVWSKIIHERNIKLAELFKAKYKKVK